MHITHEQKTKELMYALGTGNTMYLNRCTPFLDVSLWMVALCV